MPDAIRNLPAAPAAPWMRALPPAMRFILHGDAQVRAAAAPVWGVDWAEVRCRARVQDWRAALWLGSDGYLLSGRYGGARGCVLAALENALAQVPHALVDISHRQFALEVSGPRATR